MTLPPYQRQGYGSLMIEFSQWPLFFAPCATQGCTQAMSCPDEKAKLALQRDHYQISDYEAISRSGWPISSASSGTNTLTHPWRPLLTDYFHYLAVRSLRFLLNFHEYEQQATYPI